LTTIIRTDRLVKLYKGTEAVSGVSMTVRKGEIYGFLGPNGAGKTTVLKMLCNLIKPTSGTIELFDRPLTPGSYDVLRRIGSMIEYPIFYEKLTARKNLELHCEYMGYYNPKAIDEALGLVHLNGVDGKPVSEFSLGMKQRLGIARAIITRPELLLLDEPINGLDPAGIKDMRDLLRMLSSQYGMTILLSSHMLSEIEQIADTIGVINEGRLIKEVPMDSVRAQSTEYTELVLTDCKKACIVLEEELRITNYKLIGSSIIRIYEPGIPQSSIAKALIMHDIGIESQTKKQITLEQYFLEMIRENSIA